MHIEMKKKKLRNLLRNELRNKICLAISVGSFFAAQTAFAAPSISSVSNALRHGQSVTISGNGFGIKNPVAPLKWDPVDGMYAGLSNGNRIPVGASYPWNEGYAGESPYYKTINPRGKWTAKYSNNPNSNIDAAHEWAAVGGEVFPEANNKSMYVTWWNWVSANGTLDNSQNKFTRFTPTGQWEIASIIWSPEHTTGYDFSQGYRFGAWHESFINRGAWNRMEKILDNGSLPYHPRIRLSVNNEEFLDCYSGKVDCMSGGASEGNLASINGIGALGWMPEFDYSPDAATVDFGEIYVDNTLARVEICESSTKAASSHCEIQLPQNQWADTALEISVNQGSFSDGSSAYLYVVDANGSANASGYPITFGSSQGASYDIFDFLQFIAAWLTANAASDKNSDGIVNTKDLGILMSGWE
ncbi:MAG TPA: hypothetical protein PKA31_00225 [Candidatus Moranbacteria bacterium]|nr:hypothetical protein [Candidatus Moranbacteria bacterium]